MKPKMLIVNDLLQGGGVEKLMLDLVWAWHEKYDISILTDGKDIAFGDLYPCDVNYFYVYPPSKSNNKFFKWFYDRTIRRIQIKKNKKKVEATNYDIAIAIKEGWKMKDVAPIPAKKKYCWVHTDYSAYYYTQGIFGNAENELNCMKQFDQIVCVSQSIADSIVKVIGDPGNLTVKYNPIHVDAVIEKSKEKVVDIDSWDLQQEGKDHPVRFVTVGRLNYQKGFDLLLEACNMLEKDGLDFEVLVVGAEEPWGDEHNRLYRTVERLGLKNVKFIGGRKNPYKYMAIADWFLSSSIFEGYSLVSQEAAVLDVPMILTDVSGVRELLGDSEYGIVVEPSVKGIYEGMKRIIEHPELRDHYQNKIMERKAIISYQDRIDQIEKMFVQ